MRPLALAWNWEGAEARRAKPACVGRMAIDDWLFIRPHPCISLTKALPFLAEAVSLPFTCTQISLHLALHYSRQMPLVMFAAR